MSRDWDGSLPLAFVNDLPGFTAHRNNGNRVIIGIPGQLNVVYREHLPRALEARYGLTDDALKAAETEVMRQVAPMLRPPPRHRIAWWRHAWQDMV